jgi:protein TonB
MSFRYLGNTALFIAITVTLVGCSPPRTGENRNEFKCTLDSPGNWEVGPRVVTKAKPAYPEMAKRAGLEGTVCLEVSLSASGEVLEVEVLRGAHPILDREALLAARKSVFQPAKAAGITVASRLVLEFAFVGR